MQRTPSKTKSLIDENPFSLSLGDLMAGLLLIFVLLLSFVMLDLMEKEKIDSKINKRLLEIFTDYVTRQEKLYKDIEDEFEEDLPRWNAILDQEKLSVRFKEPDVLFKQGKVEVQPAFKQILDDFFPRYIEILRKPDYENDIAEIRIEGHTSSEWSESVSQQDAYILNMELSQDRTRSVLQYVLQLPAIGSNRDWIQQHLTANGLSSSRFISYPDGTQNPEESRRVEFRVRTNAEKQLEKIKELEHLIKDRQ